MKTDVLRVAADSPPPLIAGAIAGQVREKGYSEVQAIGMAASYQMFKAAIIAQQYVTAEDIWLMCTPEFVGTKIESEAKTAMRLTIRRLEDDSLPDN